MIIIIIIDAKRKPLLYRQKRKNRQNSKKKFVGVCFICSRDFIIMRRRSWTAFHCLEQHSHSQICSEYIMLYESYSISEEKAYNQKTVIQFVILTLFKFNPSTYISIIIKFLRGVGVSVFFEEHPSYSPADIRLR